jgi:cytochrome c
MKSLKQPYLSSCLPIIAACFALYTTCFPAYAHAASTGMQVFNEECAECHSVKEGKNKKGPSLWNILGRKSASVPDFKYSDAMKASGIVWTEDRIAAYMEHPKKIVPSGIMKYEGLDDPAARKALLKYLASLHS